MRKFLKFAPRGKWPCYLLKERNFRIQLVFGGAVLTIGALIRLERQDFLAAVLHLYGCNTGGR